MSRLLTYDGTVTSAARQRDEVDELLAAWQRERPEADVEPLAVLSRVTRLAKYLDSARRQAFTEVGLETWEFDVLAALRRAGRPYSLSPGQLGSATLVTSGTVTNRVDRLELRGFVRREPDADDRRGIRVVLTEQGRQVVDQALDDLLMRERAILSALSGQQRAQLANLLRTLVLTFDQPA
jgi:DNA-binding MarR family transcriptional regulator